MTAKIKTLFWNLGIMVINVGYKVRNNDFKPTNFIARWYMGVFILKLGYWLRGQIPKKTWKWNHI